MNTGSSAPANTSTAVFAGWPAWTMPALLLAFAVVARVAWLVIASPPPFAQGEIANVAISFARSGTIADAFRAGQGPTAHVLPLPPVYAGLIYRTLGVRTPAAEAVLAASALAITVGGYGLLYASFGLMGMSRAARLAALGIVAVLPLNFALETIDFRIWDGGFAVLLALGFLYALLRLDRAPVIGTRTIIAMAFGAAMVLFVNPALGLGAYTGSLLLLIDRVPPRRWAFAIGIAIVALGVVLTPWTLRNRTALGETVVLRSNAGLEFALANHPAAVAGTDQRRVFRDRLEEIHPYESESAFAAMTAAGGEVRYAKALGDATTRWAKAHPGDVATLSLRHLRQYFFPSAWMWNVYSDKSNAVGTKQAITWGLTAAGLAGALAAAVMSWRRYRYALLMLMLPALVYMTVQPVLRYRYIMFGLIVFFALYLADRITRRVRQAEGKSVA